MSVVPEKYQTHKPTNTRCIVCTKPYVTAVGVYKVQENGTMQYYCSKACINIKRR